MQQTGRVAGAGGREVRGRSGMRNRAEGGSRPQRFRPCRRGAGHGLGKGLLPTLLQINSLTSQ